MRAQKRTLTTLIPLKGMSVRVLLPEGSFVLRCPRTFLLYNLTPCTLSLRGIGDGVVFALSAAAGEPLLTFEHANLLVEIGF